MTANVHIESLKAFDRAMDAIENAKYNFDGGFFIATANRAYYACYYSLIALLHTQGVYAKTPQGTKAKFAELFIKTGIFPLVLSDAITLLFDYRQEADYDLDAEISMDEAQMLIDKAGDIYLLCRTYFTHHFES